MALSIRQRVLRVAVRHGCLSAETVADLKSWDHGGGFSVHAGVLIEAEDRAALERLLRYCARPAFASERLEWESGANQSDGEGSQGTDNDGALCVSEVRVRYRLPKPGRHGKSVLVLTPLQFLDRLAALIPPPRRHRHPYHGAFAPHAGLRPLVAAHAGRAVAGMSWASALEFSALPDIAPSAPAPANPPPRRRASALWAWLIARIYDALPLSCPQCGTQMKLIAFITEPVAIRGILTHVGESVTPPPLSPRARAPPQIEIAHTAAFAFDQSSDPEFQFDQRLAH